MIYLLDTNTCIYYLKGQSAHLRHQLESKTEAEIRLCSIVRAELLVGALLHANSTRRIDVLSLFLFRFDSLPFDDSASNMYALLRAQLTRANKLIGPNDMAIAATALAHNLTVVTHNTKDFNRVQGLQIEDWY